MMQTLQTLLNNPIASAFLIVAIGMLLGRVEFRRIGLGSSAVLFVALVFGHFGWGDTTQVSVLGQLGVVLFVYAVGLQAGPSFLRTVRHKGITPLVVALLTIACGAGAAAFAGWIGGLDAELVVGIFAGALTSTPALAAASEVADPTRAAMVSVAYGVAYPFGVVGVVLFAQLVPRWLADHPSSVSRQPDPPASEPVIQRAFLVQNPACLGRKLSELRLHELVSINISRICRGDEILPSTANVALQPGDLVLAVGTSRELDRLPLLVGPPVPAEVEMREVPSVVARDIYVSEHGFAGKRLRDLHLRTKYNIVITRVRRESVEFVPRGDFVLEVGDLVRAVGYEPDVQAFSQAAGIREQRIHETGIPQFAVGLVIGLLVGMIPLPVPGVGSIKLGLAGGPLFVGLLLGHFGRIGQLRVHVPFGARYLMRELGLVLFLASAGLSAGAELIPILREHGFALVAVAIASLVGALAGGFYLAYVQCKQSVPSTMGMTCGAMTSTPGLGAASAQFDNDVPALSYASVYPLALVLMTIVAQIMMSTAA